MEGYCRLLLQSELAGGVTSWCKRVPQHSTGINPPATLEIISSCMGLRTFKKYPMSLRRAFVEQILFEKEPPASQCAWAGCCCQTLLCSFFFPPQHNQPLIHPHNLSSDPLLPPVTIPRQTPSISASAVRQLPSSSVYSPARIFYPLSSVALDINRRCTGSSPWSRESVPPPSARASSSIHRSHH